jgi:two-component system OmpR family response regulator
VEQSLTVQDHPIHILIVEDDRGVRESLARYLTRNQCRIVQAGNAAEARRLLHRHSFDLVILDIMMPGEDGFSLCRELLARIKTIIRRARTMPKALRLPDAKSFAFGTWTLKTAERELVGQDGVTTPLSAGEFRLLLQFVLHPRTILSREQLIEVTQGREAAVFDRSIDNQVARIRRKIEADIRNPRYIKTVWGGGYLFAADVQQQ